MKTFYLVAATIGTILPWWPFFPFLVETGLRPSAIFQALYANGATSGLSNDFFITCVIFWVFVIQDARRLAIRGWWFVLPCAPLVGLSMAVPAYLYLREKAYENE